MLDEPATGSTRTVAVDPDLLRSLAEEGRTVFVSSHPMSEMQQTAEIGWWSSAGAD